MYTGRLDREGGTYGEYQHPCRTISAFTLETTNLTDQDANTRMPLSLVYNSDPHCDDHCAKRRVCCTLYYTATMPVRTLSLTCEMILRRVCAVLQVISC
jgi:hypothetical protein